ncbi:MAG: hypothetical protein ACREOF_12950 [Gemmatimonadales bacterium]
MDRRIPLWALFIAVQLLDVLWVPLVLLGIEKVRIAPGITASNPLDLYYMPYTHSLVAAILWSAIALGMLGIQATIFFGPPPSSDRAAAVMVVASYAVFAGVIAWWEHRNPGLAAVAA